MRHRETGSDGCCDTRPGPLSPEQIVRGFTTVSPRSSKLPAPRRKPVLVCRIPAWWSTRGGELCSRLRRNPRDRSEMQFAAHELRDRRAGRRVAQCSRPIAPPATAALAPAALPQRRAWRQLR